MPTVAKLVYSSIASVDGYVADERGKFDWAAPSDEVHATVNDLSRSVGTFLFGRRMYEVLAAWETMETEGQPDVIADFKDIWLAADKIVYSRTLNDVWSARTRIEREFDPEEVRTLKASSDRDLSIGGPELAGQALRAGLVDELHLFAAPYVAGGGTRFLPDGLRLELELQDERRFENGTVFVRYRVGR
jgi:dihydrofolate reductase